MMYSNAKYYSNAAGDTVGIAVYINGMISFVPIDVENTDYQNIMQLVAQGKLVIAPADA